jgi:hypothetical protein
VGCDEANLIKLVLVLYSFAFKFKPHQAPRPTTKAQHQHPAGAQSSRRLFAFTPGTTREEAGAEGRESGVSYYWC